MLRLILKMLAGLAGGVAVGLLIAGVGLICFTDTTFTEFITHLGSAGFARAMIGASVALVAFALSSVILITLHEAGHLVCGLMSGYKFVSFRIFSLTIVKSDGGRFRIKHFSVAGTGGQCLLSPPDLPIEKIPVGWYNFGGLLANLIAALAVIPLLFVGHRVILTEVIVIYLLTDAFFLLINGIPMKIGGIGNDAYNLIALRKNFEAKRGMIMALKSNALIQQGMTPSELPARRFETDREIDCGNSLEVSLPLMAASRLVDSMDYRRALQKFEELYAHRSRLIGFYVKEIECELVFLRLVCGDVPGAKMLFTPELSRYIEAYGKTMSSKQRILCAVALIMEHDRFKAQEIYDTLRQKAPQYLLQGEVKSDLAIMQSMLTATVTE